MWIYRPCHSRATIQKSAIRNPGFFDCRLLIALIALLMFSNPKSTIPQSEINDPTIRNSNMLRQSWWKILSIVLLLVTFIAGFLGNVPAKPILNETIRNLYFHVAMWFCMMIFFTISLIYSIKFLRGNKIVHDWYAVIFAQTGIVFGLLGLSTGMIWANYTWGKAWSNDPK